MIKKEDLMSIAQQLSIHQKKDIKWQNAGYALFLIYQEKQDLSWIFDMYDLDLNSEQAFNVLKDFDFEIFDQIIETDSSVTEDISLYEKKVAVKVQNVKWIIHRYDADPFPSNPHAHNIDDNIKLDLSTGECFRHKKLLKTISQKELIEIRTKAVKVFKGALPDLLV